jgi:carboxyl-terminal processing protease
MPVMLEKLAQADRLHEADLKGALKNTDPVGPGGKPATSASPGPAGVSGGVQNVTSVATADIGSANDEQLTEAVDVLRGLALVSSRAN